ncbi:MAG TPA: hypothetical protein ENJ95_06415 [Bacteroidetes bacterium]|nr:hypothetical protein [Bacteroidota bacterium]
MPFYLYISLLAVYLFMPNIFIENNLVFGLAMFAYVLGRFVWRLGKKLDALSVMALYATGAYLLAPALSYYLVETDWYKGFNTMSVPYEEYFRVAVPGILALLGGLSFPYKSLDYEFEKPIERIREYLEDKPLVGVQLFWTGIFCTLAMPFVPNALGFFFELGSALVYIGALYIWLSPTEIKLPYYIATAAMPLLNAIKGGMYGGIIFWGLLMLIMVLPSFKVKIHTRLLFVASGFLIVLFLQSVKYEIRRLTWFAYDDEVTGLDYKLDLYQRLIGDRVEDPTLLFGEIMLSGALDRTNQGSLTSMAIRYTPQFEPYANGETIFLSTLGSFVPRFIWPDKPKAGGRENMLRFTGYDIGDVTAMDIGQLGDAYVNFGAKGGAVFLFFYGLLFCTVYMFMFKISAESIPTLILWIPLIYTGVSQADTSVLVCLNHLIKSSMFMLILFIGFEKIFGTKL